jgi:sec-independent protein translocase protein TatC
MGPVGWLQGVAESVLGRFRSRSALYQKGAVDFLDRCYTITRLGPAREAPNFPTRQARADNSRVDCRSNSHRGRSVTPDHDRPVDDPCTDPHFASNSEIELVDRLARPKDDLFENSTMTFGEHLEELRQCLVKSILWLAVGLVGGLFFADHVIIFVKTPLEAAIQEFNADRDLHRLGYEDPHEESLQGLRDFLMQNSLIWQLSYEIPDEYQSLTMDSIVPAAAPATEGAANSETAANDDTANDDTADDDAAGSGEVPQVSPVVAAAIGTATIEPVELSQLLSSLPDPSKLKPKLSLVQNKVSVSSLKMEEPFMIWVKAGLIVGAIFASPMIFYHLWAFVAAGLHYHERKYVYLYMPISVTLFVSGVVLAFFLVLHYVLNFLLAFNGSMDVAVEPRLTYYINFVLLLPLGFGIAFQLPLVMLFLQRIGLFETQAYIDSWKVAILVIFVLSMLLTPADVTSMVALAIPLVFLYVLGILMCRFIPRGRGMGSAAYDPA